MTHDPATIIASETRLMHSKYTGRTYRISIGLPLGYAETRAEGWPFDVAPARWPVVYLLDANWFFGMVTEMVRSMAWCGGTSDAIVVGIGYPDKEDPQEMWLETMARRNQDFTAVHSEAREKDMREFTKRPIHTGDAGQFHKFIREELIPLIERDYRADPSKRVLAGHSLAAEFTAFAMFEAPDVFDTYIMASMASPNAGEEYRYAFKLEEAFAKSHERLAAKVYLSIGELEGSADDPAVTEILRLADVLESRGYEGLSLVKRVFADLNHCEVIAPSYQAGLMFALKQ